MSPLPMAVRLHLAAYASRLRDDEAKMRRLSTRCHDPKDAQQMRALAACHREDRAEIMAILADDDDERARPVDLRGVFPEAEWRTV